MHELTLFDGKPFKKDPTTGKYCVINSFANSLNWFKGVYGEDSFDRNDIYFVDEEEVVITDRLFHKALRNLALEINAESFRHALQITGDGWELINDYLWIKIDRDFGGQTRYGTWNTCVAKFKSDAELIQFKLAAPWLA
jgi:hypothetical protein